MVTDEPSRPAGSRSRGSAAPVAPSVSDRKRACSHASMPDGEHRSADECGPVTFEDDAKKPSHLGTLEALLTDPDHRRTVMPPHRQASMKVSVEGDGHPVMLPAPCEDRLVVGCGEAHLAGVDAIDAIASQQLGRSSRDTLVEEDPHDAVGRSAFSSPTIAAA